jgi:DnaK suppressor protein
MDDEGLTPAQRQVLRNDLLKLSDELAVLLRDDTGLARTVVLDQSTVGRLSRMDAMQQQATAQAGLRRHALRLVRVRAALERMETDPEDFGWCPDCEESIGWRRLLAFPDAVLCVVCQGKRGL